MSKKSSTFAPAFRKSVVLHSFPRDVNQRSVCRPKKRSTIRSTLRAIYREVVRVLVQAGAIAQLVEQRTENPCVTGSIPVGTTEKNDRKAVFFCSPFTNNCSQNPLLPA